MVTKVRISRNSSGFRELMSSAEMQADLEARAERIATAAGGAPDFEAEVSVGRDRAHAFVKTANNEGRRAEAERRALTRAIDAGR